MNFSEVVILSSAKKRFWSDKYAKLYLSIIVAYTAKNGKNIIVDQRFLSLCLKIAFLEAKFIEGFC